MNLIKTSSEKPDLSTLTLGEEYVGVKNRIYVYASMPCPLKVPFSQFVKPFVTDWNNHSKNLPLYCPTDTDCSTENLKDKLCHADSEDDLPDIYITTAYDVVFSKIFKENYIDTGIYGAFPMHYYSSDYPSNVVEASKKLNVGFLGFSSWGMIRDLSVKSDIKSPESWNDIILPYYLDMFSLHGCHDHAGSLSMLMSLVKNNGKQGIPLFAKNVRKVKHFSKLINELNKNISGRTPFYILPYVAINHIPSSKKIEILSLQGSNVTPMMCMVKQSKLQQCSEVIRFFTGNKFKELLTKGACFQPDKIDGIAGYNFEDVKELSENYYEQTSELTRFFIRVLGDKMV